MVLFSFPCSLIILDMFFLFFIFFYVVCVLCICVYILAHKY